MAKRAGLENREMETRKPTKTFEPLYKHWRERSSRITVLYRRLPSFTVDFRILFPPRIPYQFIRARSGGFSDLNRKIGHDSCATV